MTLKATVNIKCWLFNPLWLILFYICSVFFFCVSTVHRKDGSMEIHVEQGIEQVIRQLNM